MEKTLKANVQKELIEMGKIGMLAGKNIPSIFRRAEFSDYSELNAMSVSEIASLFADLN